MGRPLRLHFQETPWDLYLVGVYLGVTSAVILATQQGLLAAIFLVLFVPGYVLVAALFPGAGGVAELVRDVAHAGEPHGHGRPPKPRREAEEQAGEEGRKGEIDWIERIALSFGLSIAVVPLLGLLLNFTPFGIRLVPIVVSILVFSGGLGVVAYWRRIQLPVEERLLATFEMGWPAWRAYSALDKGLTVALVASLLFSASVLAYVVTTPRPGERFTEFFLLGPEGRAEGYPSGLNVSEPGSVIIGVANHEFEVVSYALRVDLAGVEVFWNETSGFNETVEQNRTTMDSFSLTLDHGQNWTQPYAFAIAAPGTWRVQFLLFRDGDLVNVYRNLHLFVRVETAG